MSYISRIALWASRHRCNWVNKLWGHTLNLLRGPWRNGGRMWRRLRTRRGKTIV